MSTAGFLLIVLAFTPAVSSETTSQETAYVATNETVVIVCSPEPHRIVPERPDPQDPAWVFSGEPECAAGDADNELRRLRGEDSIHHGYGAARHPYGPEHAGSAAWATTDDVAFGNGASYLHLMVHDSLSGEADASEGCGPQSITLPSSPHPHWDQEPSTYWWAFIPTTGVTDDLSVCFGTTGILLGTWGE